MSRWPKLWLRLWFVYTFVSVVGVTLVVQVQQLISNVYAYQQAYTTQNLQRFVDAEVAALTNLPRKPWEKLEVDEAATAFFKRTQRFYSDDDKVKRSYLPDVSDPLIFVRVEKGGVLLFEAANRGIRDLQRLSPEALSVEATLGDEKGPLRFLVHLDAPFEWTRLVVNTVRWLPEIAIPVGIVSLITGLISALTAARYITKKLALMDQVTAQWRLGDFDQAIDLGSADELGTHAQRLNAMADELESHLHVKQALAVSQERTRIARDLHDTVKQNLFALGLQLAVLRQSIPKEEEPSLQMQASLKEAEAITKEAQRDLVAVIDQLQPTGDAPKTLGTALSLAADDLNRRLATPISLDVEDDFPVAPTREIDIGRIVRELVTNAVRHGRAKTVNVSLKRRGQDAQLNVKDDGTGFDDKMLAKGLGLTSVEQRVNGLPEGSLDIRSAPGEGVTASICWSQADA